MVVQYKSLLEFFTSTSHSTCVHFVLEMAVTPWWQSAISHIHAAETKQTLHYKGSIFSCVSQVTHLSGANSPA